MTSLRDTDEVLLAEEFIFMDLMTLRIYIYYLFSVVVLLKVHFIFMENIAQISTISIHIIML